jgi:hypothetical protein
MDNIAAAPIRARLVALPLEGARLTANPAATQAASIAAAPSSLRPADRDSTMTLTCLPRPLHSLSRSMTYPGQGLPKGERL